MASDPAACGEKNSDSITSENPNKTHLENSHLGAVDPGQASCSTVPTNPIHSPTNNSSESTAEDPIQVIAKQISENILKYSTSEGAIHVSGDNPGIPATQILITAAVNVASSGSGRLSHSDPVPPSSEPKSYKDAIAQELVDDVRFGSVDFSGTTPTAVFSKEECEVVADYYKFALIGKFTYGKPTNQDLEEPTSSVIRDDSNTVTNAAGHSNNVTSAELNNMTAIPGVRISGTALSQNIGKPASTNPVPPVSGSIQDNAGCAIMTVFVPVKDSQHCSTSDTNLFDVQVGSENNLDILDELGSAAGETELICDLLSESNDDFDFDTGGGSDRSVRSGESPRKQSFSNFEEGSALVDLPVLKRENTKIERRDLWDDLLSVSQNQIPWMVGGDFNIIRQPNEKKGGAAPIQSDMEEFNDMLLDCSLTDGGFVGSPYTWYSDGVWQRLDRVLLSSEWFSTFPSMSITHLPKYKSDHNSLF
ncbi:hypothetical protein OROMI_016532 [Orobanche minor]